MDANTSNRKMFHMEIRRADRDTLIPFDVLAESEEAALEQLPKNFVFVRFTEQFSWPKITELEVIEP